MKYRKKPVVVEATQWFKNGDHPQDECRLIADAVNSETYLSEGKVVRRFRRPGTTGPWPCQHCGNPAHDHGWIDTVQGGHIVCPGDWIITDDRVKDPRGYGHYYPCKPDIFAATYEPVADDDFEGAPV